MKKKGQKSLTGLVEVKPCKKLGGKRKKSCLEPLTDQIERESLKNFEKVYEHMRNSVFKKLSIRFSTDRKLDSIGRKCFD